MEVPDSYVPPVPVPILVEKTFTPGADTFGFKAPSPLRGPPELKEAASLKPTSGTFAGATEALTGDGAATKVAVSLNSSSMNGIVATSIIGLKNPARLLTTPIATAWAACALVSFWSNEQVPRDTMTRAPAAPLAG